MSIAKSLPRTLRLVAGATSVVKSRTGAPPSRKRVDAQLVQDPARLADLLDNALQVVELLTKLAPRPRIDFEDITCTSGTDVRLEHRFDSRVRWWVVDWSGSAAPNLRKDSANTNANTLVLDCGQSGTATIRVEAV